MPILDASQQRYMRLKFSLGQPAVLNWEESGRPEELQRIQNQPVKFTWGGVDLFVGKLRIQEPSITHSEKIRFSAVDGWEWLNNHIFTKNQTTRVEYNNANIGQPIKTCGEILKEVLDQAIADGWEGSYTQTQLDKMTVKPPMEKLYIKFFINRRIIMPIMTQ